MVQISYQQLAEWRRKSHQTIDIYFEEKIQHLVVYLNEKLRQYKEELDNILTKILPCKREQETTHEQVNFLAFKRQNLRKNNNRIQQNDAQIQNEPLLIDRNLISFNQ